MEAKQLQETVSWKIFDKVLDQDLLEKIQMDFDNMTKLQKEVLEFFFDEERHQLDNVEAGAFVIAPAGNGKTLCFAIPALHYINFDKELVRTTREKNRFKGKDQEFDYHVLLPQVVIIIDTQSMCDQIEDVIKQITPTTGKWEKLVVQKLYQGINLHEIVDEQGKIKGCHVLISTPDLLTSKVTFTRKNPQYPTRVDLSNCIFFAIDEAEQVISNHQQQIELLIKGSAELDKAGIKGARENKGMNICLASATLDKRTRDEFKWLWFSDTQFRSFRIELKLDGVFSYAKQLKTSDINEAYDEVINILKLMIIEKKMNTQIMIFMDEINQIKSFEERIQQAIGNAIKYDSYYSKKDKKDKILNSFRRGEFEVLFCTNVLARGIDIRKVSLVINIYAPRDCKFKDGKRIFYMDSKIYMHRVGRTGRFADQGVAITLLKGFDQALEPVQDNKLQEKLVEFVTNFKLQEHEKVDKELKDRIKKEIEESENLKLKNITYYNYSKINIIKKKKQLYEEMIDQIVQVIKNNEQNLNKKVVEIIQNKEKQEEEKVDN